LRTKRGFYLQCSHFIPKQDKHKGKRREWQKMPVVVYLHGNASSRLEAGSLVAKLLERKISLFCFDWAGCGISEGDYVSLGWHERDDLATVIEHLRESQSNGPIGIWGRSMGAVTALMHADRDSTLAGICLDSPFSSLRELIEDIAQSDRLLIPVPTWLVNGIISVIRMRVKALADFDIEDLVPLNHGPKSSVPALFMHGLQDTFVLPRHSEKLYNNYAGNKEILMFDGDHNNERCEKVISRGVGFLCRAFRKHEVQAALLVPPRTGEVSQHLSDVHSDLHTQAAVRADLKFAWPSHETLWAARRGQGQEGGHQIPHLPRPSSFRQALGDISNVEQQGPGARANEAEAALKYSPGQAAAVHKIVCATLEQLAEDSIIGPPVGPASVQSNRRPAPRKFASSLASHRPASPIRKAQERYSKGAPDLPLTNKGYPTTGKTSGQPILTPREGRTPRVKSQTPRGPEKRRPGSKGLPQRSGSSLKAMISALASRGGA